MKDFVQLVLPSGLAVAAVAYLAKRLVTHWLDKDVQTFKNKLEATAAQETEKLKAELQLEMRKQEFAYSRMHERRAQLMADLYGQLVETHGLVCFTVEHTIARAHSDEAKKGRARWKEADASLSKTRDLFNKNRILLSDDVCDDLARCLNEYRTVLSMCEPRLDKPTPTFETDKISNFKANAQMAGYINELAEVVQRKLCSEFRVVLGVADNK